MKLNILCTECGSDLVGDATGSRIYIAPCQTCREEARDLGWKQGWEVGWEAGREEKWEEKKSATKKKKKTKRSGKSGRSGSKR